MVVAVGIYAKKLFQGGGEDAFWTTSENMYYVGWVYHPQSMNTVCVTDLVLLRRSDRVMAIFLTLGVSLRPVVYFYAEKKCTDTFDPQELEAINDLIGKQRDDVRTVWVELKVWKKELPDGDVLDIEAFKVAVRRQHPNISEGAFDFVFGGEKHRNDVITVHAELKKVKEDLLAGTLSYDAFKAAVLKRDPNISEGAFDFVLGGEMQRDDVKTVYVELKKAKEALPYGASLDIEAFKDYIRTHHSGISEGALDFVFGGEKHRNDTKTVYAELKEVKSNTAASGQPIEATTVLEQIRKDKPGLGRAVNLALGRQDIQDDERVIAAAVDELQQSNPKPTHKDITNCIMKLHVSSTAKLTAIMKRHPLHANMTSFGSQISRLKKECSVSNIERSTHECSKCGGEITYFGNTSSIMSKKGVACLTCQRTGQLDKTVNTRSDKRTSFKRRSTILCSMKQVKEEVEQLNKEYKRESLELERLLERSSVQAQNDDLDLAAIVSNSVPVRVRVGGDVVSGEGVLSAIVSRPVTVRVRVGEPAQPPAKKRKLDPPPQQETAQVQREQQECMMQMMPLLPAITNTSIIDSVASQANSFGTFDFINYDNNESYYESSNYSYLCGAFDI